MKWMRKPTFLQHLRSSLLSCVPEYDVLVEISPASVDYLSAVCLFIIVTFRMVASIWYAAIFLLLGVSVVYSENKWIRPTKTLHSCRYSHSKRCRCHEIPSSPLHFFVTCTNVGRSYTWEDSSSQIVQLLRTEHNIISSEKTNLFSKHTSSSFHVKCATTLLFCSSASHQDTMKSFTVYEPSFIFSDDILAVCKAFDVPLKSVDFKEVISRRVSQLRCSPPVFLLYN